ncbi:MAG: serpin family protein, partial [Lachnospiraceae bacterium]|nr:serpin family protein [Lachnospiraceae bacterium]
EKANFKPLTDSPLDIFVSDVLHGARVKIDEEGCEAAAYTAIMMKATGFISDTYEFTLDRPFLFVIRNDMGAPLFVGVVNEIE